MNPDIKNYFQDWSKVINPILLNTALNKNEYIMATSKICPKPENVFRAFLECPYNNLKLVLVGQDPYPQENVATGILFANSNNTLPQNYSPSLQVFINSIDKYYNDIPCGKFTPELTYLAEQGILMLNSALTVITSKAGSLSLIWRPFIGDLLKNISTDKPDTIFVLFGNQAQSFIPYLQKNSSIIKCPHPAYCARLGTLLPDVFSGVDKRLIGLNKFPIYWK